MATASSGKLTRRGGAPAGTPSDVGTALREAREQLGVTLAEIHDRTGVSWQHLESLEAMDLARLPDQRTVVTAARRYSEVVGLDPSEVCGTVLRAWQDMHWTKAAGQDSPAEPSPAPSGRSRRRHGGDSPSSAKPPGPNGKPGTKGAAAPTNGAPGEEAPRDPGTQPHLRAFTQTAEVPLVAGGRGAASLHFADTGSIPVISRLRRGSRLAPRWLRLTVAITALLVVIGLAGMAVHHYKPQWLADLHLTHGQSPAAAASGSSAAHHGTHSSHPSAPASHSIVTQAAGSGGAGTASVTVRSASYQVVVLARAPCWIDATAPGASEPVYVGVLQAGETKSLAPVGGQLSVQFGASLVVVGVEVAGKTVPGWLFSPPTVPFTLSFATAPGS